jgi:hypothetical protein
MRVCVAVVGGLLLLGCACSLRVCVCGSEVCVWVCVFRLCVGVDVSVTACVGRSAGHGPGLCMHGHQQWDLYPQPVHLDERLNLTN